MAREQPAEQPRGTTAGASTGLRQVDLDTFFHPRSVAVVGASDTSRRPTTAMYEKISAWAAKAGASVFPVNPNRRTVAGKRCYSSLREVPAPIDLAVVLVGDAIPAIEAAIESKASFAVIFAAGFAEAGAEGEKLQGQLEELIRHSDIHVLGPNTNLNAFEEFREDLPGKAIALITQSGHQGRPVFQGQELGIRLSHWAPTGNEADLEVADFVSYFSDQPEVGAIACYVEGFKDGRTLMLAADHAAQRRVPIVAVKVGRTDEGKAMAMAHTGHLTGSDAVISAVFRQFGITRVDGLDELLDVSAALARSSPPSTDGVCIYSISGGTGAHMADLASMAGLKLPKLSAATQEKLREWIPAYLEVSNPVDNGGAPSADWRGRKILEAILADPAVGLLICPITGALPSMGNRLAEDLVEVSKITDKPVFVIWGSPVGDEKAYREMLLPSPLPTFRTFQNAVKAAAAYFEYHALAKRYRSPFAQSPAQSPLVQPPSVQSQSVEPRARASRDTSVARELLSHARREARVLSEHESKRLVSSYGIQITDEVVCTSPKEAVAAARSIGYPVVMKAVSPGLMHKSDHGLVVLGVTKDSEVRATYDRLVDAVSAGGSQAGVLVSETVSGGVECVVGVAQDGLFGPVVMFGLGGVLVEVFGEVTFRVAPFDKHEARRMVDEVRAAPLLHGARGRPPADVASLVEVIMAVQRLATDLSSELSELDINPLIVLPKGAVAVDALAVPTNSKATRDD